VRPQLVNYATADLDNLTNWYINNGWKLLIHQDGNTVQHSYTGYGIYGISPNGGAVGLINGFLHGATGDVVLTVQQNTDNSQLAEVGTGGSGNGAAPNTGGSGSGATPNTILRAEVGPNTEPAIDFNTDQFTGSSIYRHTDLVHGNGQYPLSLPFTRIYNNKDRATVTEAGRGWRHNYMIDITVQNQSYASLSDTTNPLPPLGQFAGIAASGQVVYGMIMILLAPGLSNNPAFAISAISTTEASKLLTSNVAIVRDGDKSYTFTLLSNGTYIPPKGTNLMLTKLTDHFVMQTFDGVRYTFTNWALNKNRISKIEWPSVSGYGNGLVLNFTYGGVGPDFYLTQVSNNQPGSNRALNFTYDLLGGLIPYLKKVTADSSGTLYCNYTFDPALTGHLLSTTDSNGSITSYSYDSKHRLTGYQRPNMANFSVTYDDRDRVVSQSNPKFTLTYLYQVGSTIVNGGPTSISHNFNTDGQPTAIMTGDEITYFNYDGLGRVTQKQLPAGDVINYGYDQYNRVTSETHSPGPGGGLAQNHVYSFAGLAGGASWDKWTSHTDERGQVWNRVYDTAGNLTSQTGPTIGGQTPTKSWTYNQFNQILTATDETGIVTSYTYLPIGDLQSETHDSGTGRLNLTASYTYDTLGNRVTATNPRGFTKSMQYDNLRQLTQVTETAPFSYVTNMTYDTVGNLLTTSKQTGGTPAWQTTTTTYSNTNRPLTVTDPLNNVTTHTWDTWDRHASTTDAENRQRQYQYDANSRLSAIIDANGVTEEQRTYDSAGALATIKDARNNQTTFTRDGFSRVLQTTYPDSSYESFTYDVSGNPLTHRMRSGNTITNTFDILGRLATKSPQGQAVATYAYDLANRQLSVSTPVVTGDPSSGTFSYGYDTAGRMISETNPQSQVISYQLDANGNHTKITYPSGYYATYVYDQLDRLTDIKLNGTTTSAVTFGYDQLSRRTSKNYANGANTSYTYDLGNNLLTMNIAFVGSAANWTYTYNKVHQMLTQNCSDTTYLWRPTVGTVTYAAANNLNQYSTIGGLAATYDNQGGLATYNGWTYTYNTEGMLSTASKTGASASFVYDGSLRQIQKTVGSVKTKYVYSGPHMMEEYDGTAGTLNTRYVFAGAEEPVLQMNSAGTVTYIHHDHHDSVIAQSGSTGAVGNRYNYGPFGESAALSGTTIGYTGQRFDSETGLYHYKARFYLPSIGRFLQADPIGYAAGMNLYAYCSNDGMNHTDPDGNRVVDLNRVRGDLSETTVSRDYFVYRGHGADNAVLGRHVADSKQPGAKRWSQDQVAVDITGRKGFKEAKALVLEVCDGGRNSNEKLNKYIGDKSLGESMAIKTKKNTYAYIGTVTADGHVFIKNDLKPGYSPGVDRPGEQLLFQGGTGKLLERKTVDRIELP
jgi:RHS repeat-associated protein